MNIDRRDADASLRWDLSAIYKTEADFAADCERLQGMLRDFPALREGMSESGAGLLRALEADTEATRLLSKLYEYAMLSSDLDKGDNAALARLSRVDDLENAYRSAVYFLAPTIQKIDEAVLDGFFAAEAGLSAYRRAIDLVRRELPHMLSEEGEKLLADLAPALGTQREIHSIFANADIAFGRVKDEDGNPIELTSATYVPLLMSEDRRVRRSAFRTLYKTYRQFGNTFSSLLFARIKEKVTLSRLRKFPSSLAASVFGDEVSTDVYINLIDTVR